MNRKPKPYPLLQIEFLQTSMYAYNIKIIEQPELNYFNLYVLLKDYYRVRLIQEFGLQKHEDDNGYVESEYNSEMCDTLEDCHRIFERTPHHYFEGLVKQLHPQNLETQRTGMRVTTTKPLCGKTCSTWRV